MITTNVKNQKVQKMCNKKLKFEDHKDCLQASQHENKIMHLSNNKIDVKCLIENQEKFITTKKKKICIHNKRRSNTL